MKVQIIYSSLTGCTKRLAEAILSGISADEKSIHDLAAKIPVLDGDIILFGYWGMMGGPCKEMRELMQSVQGKAVGIFCTLGYYADSGHARQTLETGINLVKDHNEIIGGYVCNGAVSRKLIANQGKDGNTVPTEQKELRWEMIKNHPTDAECALAAERFEERIWLYQQCSALNIPFSSIV